MGFPSELGVWQEGCHCAAGGRAPSAEDLGTQADIITLSVSLSFSLVVAKIFSDVDAEPGRCGVMRVGASLSGSCTQVSREKSMP